MTLSVRTILICIFLASTLHAHNLTTPKGSSVPHWHPSDTGWADPPGDPIHTPAYWTTYADGYWSGLYIERLERANQAYNCHTYAWAGSRQSNSNSWCWIDTQEDVYWTDHSYVVPNPIPSGIPGTHISYGSKEHSLLTYDAAQNIVTSKWGKYPLYKHYLYNDPYNANASYTTFYKYFVTYVPGSVSNLDDALSSAVMYETIDVSNSQTLANDYDFEFQGVGLTIRSSATINLNGHSIVQACPTIIENDASICGAYVKIAGNSIVGIFSSVESAIDYAVYGQWNGTTVVVTPGTHNLNDDLIVPSTITLQIVSGATLDFAGNHILHVDGTLIASNATFTSSSGQWGGIEFYGASSNCHLSGCTIQNAQIGAKVDGTNYFAIDHCTIQNNTTGIASISSSHIISTNNITGNDSGVTCHNYSQIDFQINNWVKFNNCGIRIDGTSTPYLGTDQNRVYCSIWGNNWDVWSDYGGTISARWNYWGSYPAYPMIYGNVDYSNELMSEPSMGKMAPTQATRPTSSLVDPNTNSSRDTVGMAELDQARAMETNPTSAEAQTALGLVIIHYPDHLAGLIALSHLSRLLEKSGADATQSLSTYATNYKSSALGAFANVLTGQVLLRKGENEGALSLFVSLTQTPKGNFRPEGLYNAGCILWYRMGAKDEAEKFFRQLVQEYPNDPLSLSALRILGEYSPNKQLAQWKGNEESDPESFNLSTGFPNPFNPTTTIGYQLPTDGFVKLVVYDLLGRQVAELASGLHAAGRYSARWNASSVASGMYFARLTVMDELGQMKFNKINKLVLAK